MKIFLLLFLFISSFALAGEWNDKPVMCAKAEEIFYVINDKSEKISFEAKQFTKVRNKNSLSDIPAYIPLQVYMNKKTGTYTIVEYHPSYDTYCVISYGTEFKQFFSF